MFRAIETLARIQKRFKPTRVSQLRSPFCAKAANANTSNRNGDKGEEANLSPYGEAYKQLDDLTFTKAAKILFTGPPSKKKFGLDFHLVQLFFACMPSLAVYLVAQYARYEIKRMEADLEQKKKKEEEAKAKEIELNATEEKEAESVPELLEVRVRLEKLEETVKEIVVESKKQMASGQAKDLEGGSDKKKNIGTEASNCTSSESGKPVEKNSPGKQDSLEQVPALSKEKVVGQPPVSNTHLQNQEGKTPDDGASQDAKR